MAYLQSRSPFKQKKDYPVMEKKLDPGVIAEANNDGTIFVSKDVSPAVQKHAVKEEIEHQKDMESGKLDYTDSNVKWDGKNYPRKNGKVLYSGKWLDEGDNRFPWEKGAKQRAYGSVAKSKYGI
tara:strand:- start:300 stop:671 length:372 start_codon:yes stop_codon:yes gene_type:complete